MKKILVILVLLVAMSSMAFAQGMDFNAHAGVDTDVQPVVAHAGVDTDVQQTGHQYMSGSNDEPDSTGHMMMKNELMVHSGLANALLNVKNDSARARIQANMDKFIAKYQARLDTAEDLKVNVDEETGGAQIKVKEHVKFFGLIKGKVTKTFDMDAHGKISEKAPWYNFLYSSESSEE